MIAEHIIIVPILLPIYALCPFAATDIPHFVFFKFLVRICLLNLDLPHIHFVTEPFLLISLLFAALLRYTPIQDNGLCQTVF